MDQSSSPSITRGILTLYPDLIEYITSILPDADRHNLGRTCRYLSLLIPHQTCAVLSPDIHNIAAFRNLANDSIRRKEVTTIVYDDARLYRPSTDDHYHGVPAVPPEDTHDLDIGDETGVPSWYRKGYRISLRFIKAYGHSQQQRFEVAQRFLNPLSPRESYEIYQNLGAQQDHVIATGLDIVTLREGLDKFPNLRRVILTPAAHGTPVKPLFYTPMINRLPRELI
ncbi:Ff.00g010260.m01.CDS01 [Fusarium sp. VM40]|nr:Ff.00g010260.m01.CDS01 [Fusarium sp. VM40]